MALTAAAKLQQVRANSREMTSQKLNEEHEILRRFMAVVVSSAFKNSFIGFGILFRVFPAIFRAPLNIFRGQFRSADVSP